MKIARIRKVLHRQIKGPRRLRIGRGLVALGPGPHVAHAHAALVGHAKIGPGEFANDAMTGAVDEQTRDKLLLPAGARVEGRHRHDLVSFSLDGKGMMIEEEVEVFLGTHDRLALRILELLGGRRAGLGVVRNFLDDLADAWILAAADVSHGPDADLAGAVAAEHGTILHEGDLAAHACRGQGRAASRIAAADHDQVVTFLERRLVRKVQQLATPGRQNITRVRGRLLLLGEEDRIAAAVETRQIAEGQRDLAGGKFDRAAVVPMPIGPFGAERLLERLAIDKKLKPPRLTRRLPASNPVHRAGEDPIGTGRGRLHDRDRVGDRTTQAMGQEIWRTHRLNELRIKAPSAMFVERLRLHEERLGPCMAGHRG